MRRMVHCALAVLVPAVLLLAAPATATAAKGPAAAGTIYGGYTAQSAPLVVTLNAKRTAIKTVGIFIESPDSYVFGDTGRVVGTMPPVLEMGDNVITGGRIARSGKFTAAGQAATAYGPELGLMSYRLSGKVKRRTMSGTLEGRLALADPGGAPQKTVDFPKVKWVATSAARRVFGGMTADRTPMVLELDAARAKAKLRIPWAASSDAGSWVLSETFTGLSLNGGVFSRSWSERYTRDDGGTNTFDYALDIEVTGTKAGGKLQVKVTETSAAGAVQGAYDSGVITFSGRSSKR